MAYQFVTEDPTPAQKPLFESAPQVTDQKTQKIYAHKELFVGNRGRTAEISLDCITMSAPRPE
jgi:hypothetical protein